jgi:hypothetical protein
MEKIKTSGAIRPSDSTRASPIVLAQKKDRTICFCVDYGNVNDVTKKDAYLLPRVEESLEALQGYAHASIGVQHKKQQGFQKLMAGVSDLFSSLNATTSRHL